MYISIYIPISILNIKIMSSIVHKCLYQHLPIEIHLIILEYAYTPINDTTIHSAIKLWCSNRERAIFSTVILEIGIRAGSRECAIYL